MSLDDDDGNDDVVDADSCGDVGVTDVDDVFDVDVATVGVVDVDDDDDPIISTARLGCTRFWHVMHTHCTTIAMAIAIATTIANCNSYNSEIELLKGGWFCNQIGPTFWLQRTRQRSSVLCCASLIIQLQKNKRAN